VGEGNENLVYPSPWDFEISFTCRKILRHGTSGFTPHAKEGMLRIFIALKNPSPWLGSNRQTLGPVASTITTTAPRRHVEDISHKTNFRCIKNRVLLLYDTFSAV
jgi:hypothetical protein